MTDADLQATAREWVLRLATGEMSEADLTELATWRAKTRAHESAFEEARRSWRALRGAQAAFVPATQSESRRVHIRFAFAGALAAVVLLAFVWADPLLWLKADYRSGTGEVRNVTLPDGTLAVLNTRSALKLEYTGRERRVALLRGEAWFKVHHDSAHPFIVRVQGGEVRAVGTAFDVRPEAEDRVTVVVTEGTVAVSNGTAPSLRATAGEQATFDRISPPALAPRVDDEAALSWRDHRLVVRDRPLKEAVAELGRYRAGAILVLGEAASQRVTGAFDTRAVDEGLEGIAAARGLHVTHLTPFLTILH